MVRADHGDVFYGDGDRRWKLVSLSGDQLKIQSKSSGGGQANNQWLRYEAGHEYLSVTEKYDENDNSYRFALSPVEYWGICDMLLQDEMLPAGVPVISLHQDWRFEMSRKTG